MKDPIVLIINQLHLLKGKIEQHPDTQAWQRHVDRIQEGVEALGYQWQDPTGEAYDHTRTDCEATLVPGAASGGHRVLETIKPVIYKKGPEGMRLIQPAVVLVGD